MLFRFVMDFVFRLSLVDADLMFIDYVFQCFVDVGWICMEVAFGGCWLMWVGFLWIMSFDAFFVDTTTYRCCFRWLLVAVGWIVREFVLRLSLVDVGCMFMDSVFFPGVWLMLIGLVWILCFSMVVG